MLINPEDMSDDGSEDSGESQDGTNPKRDDEPSKARYPRSLDVTYLLTLADRFESGNGRGKPRGMTIIVQEDDGTHTHHIADPDDTVEWMSMIGNIEVTKASIIQTKLAWEPVHMDGTSLSEEELEEFEREMNDDDNEEGE